MRRGFSKIITMSVAALVLSASLCFAAGPVNLSSPDAKALIASKSNLFLLDVRTPEEYRQVHLKGARLIPLNELEKRVKEVPRNKPILVYCAVGARSLQAARYLSALGYRQVYQISDGIVGWYTKGFPVEKGK